MKKITKLMLTLALCVLGVGSAQAVKTIGTEYKSVADLSGKVFAIVNKADGKAICNKTGGHDYDLQYLPYAEAFAADVNGYLFKIEQISDSDDDDANGKYLIRVVKADGSEYVVSGWAAPYLQTNITGSGVCFFFALSFTGNKRGADAENTGAWDIHYDEEQKGFTLKNINTGKYINDPTKEANSDTPAYFTFCALKDLTATVSIINAETLDSNPENFTEIAQDQGKDLDSFGRATLEEGEDYNTYTASSDLTIAIKMMNVNVADCDYVVIKFAEPVAAGWHLAFWSSQDLVDVPAGSTEYKYVFAEDPKCGVKDGVLPQICMMTFFGGFEAPLKAKMVGIYKHTASDWSRTYSFNKALDFEDIGNLEAYVISAFDSEKAALTLSRVYQVPANTGLYLVGKGGDYDVPVIDSADPIATNLLHASSGTNALEPTEGTNTNLIFGGTGADRGFHPLSSAGIIGANKAYLQLPTADLPAAGSRLNLFFENETSAIKTVNDVKVTEGVWYTVNGIKLNAKPARKGIYLNNGKKFAVQ